MKQNGRIALAQINPWLGNFSYNAEKILDYAHRAHQQGAQLVVFPEMSLFGYPPYDLLEKDGVLKEYNKQFKKILSNLPKNIVVVFGGIAENKTGRGKPFENVAVVAQKSKKPIIIPKQLLPSYDVFDDTRFFNPGEKTFVGSFKGLGKVAITVCEDMWAQSQKYKTDPLGKIKKVDLVINISASPYASSKHVRRLAAAQAHVKKIKAPFIYINQVGGQDEVIFDGRSFVLDSKGKKISEAVGFREDFLVIDLNSKKNESHEELLVPLELNKRALVLGIQDFFKKTGHKKAHLGLSGGIDSSVVACLAAEALGAENVVGILLPGPYSSPGSIDDSVELAAKLKIRTKEVSINEIYNKFLDTKEHLSKHTGGAEIAQQNLQSRIRAVELMYFSNLEDSILLSTSNKSELASGYSTLYGDSCGGLAPIGDLTKKQVYEIADLYSEFIPKQVIEKIPSAELAPNQKDQDTLPPYDQLDKAVENIVEKKLEAKNQTEQWLEKKLKVSEFKRWQSPPILRVSEHAFGRGRRIPLAKY